MTARRSAREIPKAVSSPARASLSASEAATTRLSAGSSGFSYTAWRGSFYEKGLAPKAMLAAYAARLPTVELNNTFYRLPSEQTVRGWLAQVPPTFRFAVKAPQRISHQLRLRDCAGPIAELLSVVAPLGPQLAAVLVQLPPNLKRDDERLGGFLREWPARLPLALEFRHPSWFEGAVVDRLRSAGAALVIGDPEKPAYVAPVLATAGFTYLRLREETYTDVELGAWVERVAALGVNAFAYFKHETTAPEYASRLNQLSAER
jgi:uncharacterized protein YecE (DUF72 family)